MKQSYEEYRFSMTEILKYLVQGLLLCGAVDYLFYQNPWLMFLALPVTVFFLKWKKKGLIRERKKNLNYQFKDALNALSVAVQAGYSVENAVMACSNRYSAGISLYGNTAEGKCAGGRAFYEFR